MKLRKLIQNVGQTVLIILLIVLLPGMTTVKEKKTDRTTSADLGGTARFLAYVSTDKPIYRMREKVYIRSVILDAAEHTPWNGNTNAFFQVKGPKGNLVASGYTDSQDSVSGFAWSIPDNQAGGEYTITVHYPQLGIPPAIRKFDIRAYRAPRLKSQVEFLRKGYGPGDMVDAALEVSRAEGGIPANAKITITARVDGNEIHRSDSVVNGKGHCFAHFPLPKKIDRGEGILIFAIHDGGVVENAAKTIPILLQTVDLAIYPEGGDLVASVENRVYIEAKTPAQKPADISGIVVDSTGRQATSFRTEHEGRGRFSFRPRKGQTYSLKITRPSGIIKTFPVPAVKNKGVLIQSLKDIYKKGEPIKLRVVSTIVGPLTVTLSKREKEIASFKIKGNKDENRVFIKRVTFTPPSSADGILIAAVWDARGNPAAERLVYREPSQSVHIEITADKKQYTPGEKVNLTVKTRDQHNKPVSAVVGLTVTDDSVLEMMEKREQAPRLPVMVLLESDVKELADAHVYLDAKNPGAPLALDLLLGTQGWRRFAFIDTAKFLEKYGDDARRVLAMKIVTRFEDKKMRRELFMDERRQNEIVLEGLDRDKIQVAAVNVPEASAPAKDFQQALEKAQIKQDKFEMIAGEKEFDSSSKISIISAAVRVYAHNNRPDRKPGDRIDFTETLYWHAGIKTDEKTGQADVSFDMNDSVTGFKVLADAFAANGALGADSKTIESRQPFYIEPKLPLEVTVGDRILLPIGIVNGTTDTLPEVSLNPSTAEGIEMSRLQSFSIAGNRRMRKILELSIGKVTGNTDFIFDASAGAYSDRVTRKLNIVSRGFPVEIAHSGLLKPDSSLEFTIEIPGTLIPGSAASDIAVYPTPLANLTSAMERLIREPYGCFEQTSSTTYPLVMAQQYFLSHQGVDPSLIQRSKEMLDRGYKRLTGFECRENGYEWFGADPAHEALTAYGLLEFTDMAKIWDVDQEMLKRTRAWLLGTRDGKGGFKRERRALHTWIADPDCSNNYITWSLLECSETVDSLKKEIDNAKNSALASKNSYVTALGANIALADGDKKTAKILMDRLAANQTAEGSVSGAETSIVGSGGISLQVETTSLAILSWLKDEAYADKVEKSIKWLADSCQAGRYGSTQSTVLALRAIIAYDKARSQPKAPGSLQLYIDGHRSGSSVEFDKNTHGPIKLTDITEMLYPGKHKVQIQMTGGSEMPFSLAVNYSDEKPVSSKECKVHAEVSISKNKVTEGEAVEVKVKVTNRTNEVIPTPVAIIGIPGGLEVRHDQLKELVKSGKIASYEVLGREVVLYWRAMNAGQEIELPISVIAEIPGIYTAPASRAYLYYTDEHRHWVSPITVEINQAAQGTY